MSTALYEIADIYRSILEDEELSGDPESLQDTLDAVKGEIEVKVDNIGKYLIQMECDLLGLKEFEKRVTDKRRAMENKIQWLKDYTKRNLEASKIDKLQTDNVKFSIRKAAPRVIIYDENKVPQSAVQVIPAQTKIDKNKARELLKEKGGVTSWGRLESGTWIKLEFAPKAIEAKK